MRARPSSSVIVMRRAAGEASRANVASSMEAVCPVVTSVVTTTAALSSAVSPEATLVALVILKASAVSAPNICQGEA